MSGEEANTCLKIPLQGSFGNMSLAKETVLT